MAPQLESIPFWDSLPAHRGTNCHAAAQPGDIINDAEVAEELGVSRTPVREALLRLEDDGLVEVAPRRGIFVAPIDLLDHLDLLETRRQLDSLLMKFAVRRAKPEHCEN